MHKPYIPEEVDLAELTFKSLALGIFMAVILGAANAYLGLKAGMTIAAAFPAAVISIAAFRLPFFRGTVLEQNIARTTASVGEALVAGAIFTIPAFVMVKVEGERLWTSFNYWESSIILLIGGVMGILFVILLRRTLVVDADLPFPEGWACYEIVRAGQKGESGAKYVFGATGLGVLTEFLKNPTGLGIVKDVKEIVFHFPKSVINHFNTMKQPLGHITHTGGVAITTPLASPALISVGYIIGPKYSAINFSGGILAWLVFIPLAIFLNPGLTESLTINGSAPEMSDLAYTVWKNQIQPIAVGAMLVGSIATLINLRGSLKAGFKGIFSRHGCRDDKRKQSRLEADLNLKAVFIASITLVIPMVFLYKHFTGSTIGAIGAAVIMLITGFLFSAVGGWLVGLVGNSNQPVSGLTLSTLIVAAVIMLIIGIKGAPGIAAVLAVAAVVCCAACMAGDMIQDLKVGQLLGGTPWKMEIAEILSTIFVAFILVIPVIILHQGNIATGGIGIGDVKLPAPQAGLMAQLATGIVGGQMPWGLVVMGMAFSVSLLLIKAPAPMLIAVGMYLPFETTFAIFVGGMIKFVLNKMIKKVAVEGAEQISENTGTLIASGFIAGEALTGVLLAGLVLVGVESVGAQLMGDIAGKIYSSIGGWLSLPIFGGVAYLLIALPRKKAKLGRCK